MRSPSESSLLNRPLPNPSIYSFSLLLIRPQQLTQSLERAWKPNNRSPPQRSPPSHVKDRQRSHVTHRQCSRVTDCQSSQTLKVQMYVITQSITCVISHNPLSGPTAHRHTPGRSGGPQSRARFPQRQGTTGFAPLLAGPWAPPHLRGSPRLSRVRRLTRRPIQLVIVLGGPDWFLPWARGCCIACVDVLRPHSSLHTHSCQLRIGGSGGGGSRLPDDCGPFRESIPCEASPPGCQR